jgi:hypothetical protein
MSWCNFNIEISKPEDCSVLKDSNAKSPPLTILSLNLQTKMNYRENTNEIVAASMFFSKDGELVLNTCKFNT